MIIDFDSHLREGYFMDEVYKLDGPYERFRPVKLNDGRTHGTKFLHSLDPISPQGHAAHRHPYIYDPKTNWRGGDVAARQVGGYDMARRREDIGKEGIDKQLLFPTQITIATSNIGGLGRECARLFNDWVAKLVKGHEDVFLPVAMAPAGCRSHGGRIAPLREGARLQVFAPRALLRDAQPGRPELLPLLPGCGRARRRVAMPSEQQRRAGRPVRQFLPDARARASDQLQRAVGGSG